MLQAGKGGPVNAVEAYMWLSLAVAKLPAGKTRTDAVAERDDLFSQMSSGEQTQAQLLVQRWKPKSG